MQLFRRLLLAADSIGGTLCGALAHTRMHLCDRIKFLLAGQSALTELLLRELLCPVVEFHFT
jgi:hypothetical protein